MDRRQLSIHEMLCDVLELVQVAVGDKPAFLGGHGEGAAWRLEALAEVARSRGLQVRHSRPMAIGERQAEIAAASYPTLCRRLAAHRTEGEVVWVYRDRPLGQRIEALVDGRLELLGSVLGYPDCCVEHDAGGLLRELSRLAAELHRTHGIDGDAAIATALERGDCPVPEGSVGSLADTPWATRLAFPFLGFSACPACLAAAGGSPAGRSNALARTLAFELDPGYARALWAAARAEAALATAGHFQALDPMPGDPCPCGGGERFRDCCALRAPRMPEFRSPMAV